VSYVDAFGSEPRAPCHLGSSVSWISGDTADAFKVLGVSAWHGAIKREAARRLSAGTYEASLHQAMVDSLGPLPFLTRICYRRPTPIRSSQGSRFGDAGRCYSFCCSSAHR
jgi:hypothetical protein